MAYVDGLLGDGEQILVVERRHPLFLVGRIILYAIATIVLIVAGIWLASRYSSYSGLVGVLAIVPLAAALYRFLSWHREQYIVTNFRIIQVEGVLNKRVLDSSLEKVNDILLTQSVMGRVFDYGTLEILTASEIGVNQLYALAHPFRFKRAILDARTRMASDQDDHGLPPDDVVRLLAALNDLRNSGVISEDEYRAKRAQLVGAREPSG